MLWTVVTTGCHSSDPSAVDLGTQVTPELGLPDQAAVTGTSGLLDAGLLRGQ